jgi:hypothetical protein
MRLCDILVIIMVMMAWAAVAFPTVAGNVPKSASTREYHETAHDLLLQRHAYNVWQQGAAQRRLWYNLHDCSMPKVKP